MKTKYSQIVTWSFFAAGLTGTLIYLFKTFLVTEGEYGLEHHFLYDEVKLAHFLVTPLLIFSFGLIWNEHIRIKLSLQNTKKRLTGRILLVLIMASVFSAQMLLGITHELTKEVLEWVHIVSGGILFLTFIKHRYF